jgi:hypothetical protein
MTNYKRRSDRSSRQTAVALPQHEQSVRGLTQLWLLNGECRMGHGRDRPRSRIERSEHRHQTVVVSVVVVVGVFGAPCRTGTCGLLVRGREVSSKTRHS